MSTVPRALVEALSGHTPFAESIVQRQLERLGYTAESLPSAAAAQLVSNVLLATKMYVEPTTFAVIEQRVRRALPPRREPG